MEIDRLVPEDRIVRHLRSLGFNVEERRVEKWAGNESYHVWEWQIQDASGGWLKARELFRDIILDHLADALVESVTKMDVVQKLK